MVVKVDLNLAFGVIDGVTVALDMADEDNPVRLAVTRPDAFEDSPESTAIWLDPVQARVIAAQLLAAASQADARGGSSPDDE